MLLVDKCWIWISIVINRALQNCASSSNNLLKKTVISRWRKSKKYEASSLTISIQRWNICQIFVWYMLFNENFLRFGAINCSKRCLTSCWYGRQYNISNWRFISLTTDVNLECCWILNYNKIAFINLISSQL